MLLIHNTSTLSRDVLQSLFLMHQQSHSSVCFSHVSWFPAVHVCDCFQHRLREVCQLRSSAGSQFLTGTDTLLQKMSKKYLLQLNTAVAAPEILRHCHVPVIQRNT